MQPVVKEEALLQHQADVTESEIVDYSARKPFENYHSIDPMTAQV